ncbi:hypothetical protein NC653_019880 [Populus alba x Populus x berolinensis]|uniref:DUF7851 domain-containing protein n=1 Tax=Populus alba x Populus x berolinensis TaxID=444605 RepID=A0AAD6MJS0_9ROSI|nr:hypothetical protein NC653_019880 [Populus alba x Populus x berolinensis]
MEDKEKKKHRKKQKHQHPNDQTTKPSSDFSFKPSSEVKGLRFGGQFIVKSFTIRRARPLELLKVLSYPPTNKNSDNNKTPFLQQQLFCYKLHHLSTPSLAYLNTWSWYQEIQMRRVGNMGFSCADDLKNILQSVVALNDFLDHTAMLAMPHQRSINYASPQVAMAH